MRVRRAKTVNALGIAYSQCSGAVQAIKDTALVKRMLAAGMIILGKTHSVEFAMGSFGTNRHMGTPWNPWDAATHRAPGGSSSGTGVGSGVPMGGGAPPSQGVGP